MPRREPHLRDQNLVGAALITFTSPAARHDLQQTEIAEIEYLVSDIVNFWLHSSHELELTRPIKLHMLAVHVVAFTTAHRATPAVFGEQDGEASQRIFSQTMDTDRTMGSRALLHSVKVFNACLFLIQLGRHHAQVF